jgi:carbamoyl-phosphate synthase large subunit
MPKRTDIKTILLLGAGPIVIGQACEFDYSGTQACKALREEGYRVVLVNSNPATIMTDPNMADATYIEPVQWQIVAKIIELERPDALLPTMGGQTALNCALDLAREGILEKFGVELIGASRDAIDKAEDRERFRAAMTKIGLAMPHSVIAHSLEEALQLQLQIGYPAIIRPSFTMGGSGGGIAYNREEFITICERGFELSPTRELLIDESIMGWKEYELEVIRDKNDNCIIVCSIENLDPMGVHTGDSITVAPAQTLTDREYQIMRNAAIAVLREIGVDTGGSNVQFGVNPKDGRLVVIEMNPRVSRSSALASKATGFPIAKIAAKLAVGYTLDELKNEITGGAIPASFEPSIDYVVTKIPRFNFDKFPAATPQLTTQMKSVGEAMGIGRNFQESLQKAIRSLETDRYGFEPLWQPEGDDALNELRGSLQAPTPDRLWYVADAFRAGFTPEEVFTLSQIDPWFLAEIYDLVQSELALSGKALENLSADEVRALKRKGFSDKRLAALLQTTEQAVRDVRKQLRIHPVYKRIDTCAGEFPTSTAYMYSTYDEQCEALPTKAKKIMILGGGPNRIGQGIEFDYCCVHGAMALQEAGFETIMVNCNPETVSTDFDTSDRLYFEPVTLEDVLEIIAVERPDGVIVHFGGQTPLKLASQLAKAGVKIIGTSPDAIDRAEDRERFSRLIQDLHLQQPPHATVRSLDEALQAATKIGYPVMVRPSYVLGGRAMRVIYQEADLRRYLQEVTQVSHDAPLLIDRFLNDAIEIDIDAVSDGTDVVIGGIMEHIEQAGVHSGDSSCTLPAFSVSVIIQQELRQQMIAMTKALGVVGLVNAQFAIQGDDIYVLEINPRASRTVPFVSKATGLPLAKIATWCKVGKKLAELGVTERIPSFYSIKMPVFPFEKFAEVDSLLGPEMKSTGEVMGIAKRFGQAFARAQLGAGSVIRRRRHAFISVRDPDKTGVAKMAKRLSELGFELLATRGTLKVLESAGIPCQRINKVIEGRPHIVDMIKNNEIDFIVNTTDSKQTVSDSFAIRRSALQHKVMIMTTLAGAEAASLAMKYEERDVVTRLQDIIEGDVSYD